ncbi:hypothetical protein OKW22_000572 [Bacilli bacterium PM5-3]|nr:hypothetical protein [Bacilli bacterium PM5-3]MDH6603186.1 hypothetical protein [Bacilli bacterium PM5-9]
MNNFKKGYDIKKVGLYYEKINSNIDTNSVNFIS